MEQTQSNTKNLAHIGERRMTSDSMWPAFQKLLYNQTKNNTDDQLPNNSNDIYWIW